MSSYGILFYVALLFSRLLVDLKWFKKWKKYIGFESYDVRFTGKRVFFPGSIDNSALFKSMKFSNDLYYFLWDLLQTH